MSRQSQTIRRQSLPSGGAEPAFDSALASDVVAAIALDARSVREAMRGASGLILAIALLQLLIFDVLRPSIALRRLRFAWVIVVAPAGACCGLAAIHDAAELHADVPTYHRIHCRTNLQSLHLVQRMPNAPEWRM
jgi:hypothetical protein